MPYQANTDVTWELAISYYNVQSLSAMAACMQNVVSIVTGNR